MPRSPASKHRNQKSRRSIADNWSGRSSPTKLVDWESGRSIRFFRSQLPDAVVNLIAGIGVIAGAVAGAFLLTKAFGGSIWLMALGGAFGGGLLTWGIASYVYREREVICDWSSEEVRWCVTAAGGDSRRSDEIEALTLRGTSRSTAAIIIAGSNIGPTCCSGSPAGMCC